MSSLSSVIYGIKGAQLSADEISLFKSVNPYGYIVFSRNIQSPEQLTALIGELKSLSGREQLPVLVDQEGGRVARLTPPHWRKYPPASVFADLATKDLETAKRAVYSNARMIAQELCAVGITVDCAPVADVPVEGAHDVIGDRAFGRTSSQVAALARAQAEGLADGGVVPVLKHIPGHGRASCDSHLALPQVDTSLEVLRKTDFASFKALADLPMAMTAHVLYTALDKEHVATLSPVIINIIRNEIGFDGLLMTDDLSMKALGGSFVQRTEDSLRAGCDVILHCNGKMDEMQEVAKGLSALSGVSLARAERAMVGAGNEEAFDLAEAQALLDRVLPQAA